MMKRFIQLSLVGACTLALAATAVAQQVPTQVTRMGDWVEIANDMFLNIIASTEWTYQTSTNTDFESKIRDRPATRSNLSTVSHNGGAGDLLWEESRFGVDLRYRKNLTMQVLFENQMTIDGNRIDNGVDLDGDSPFVQDFEDGRNLSCGTSTTFVDGNGVTRTINSPNGDCDQRNTVNLERAWINYQFPNTPLTLEVGAKLWFTDPAGVLGDDDPRIAVFLDLGQLQLQAAAVIQTESLRIGLTNDNDDVYYTFGAKYDLKPFTVGLDVAYFRFRFQGARGQAFAGQEIDSVLIQPSITGSVGLLSFLAQPMLVWGEAEGSNAGGNRDFDIFGYGFIGQVEADLGMVRPFFAVVFASGDGNPDDTDLNAFAHFPQREITLAASTRYFNTFTATTSWGGRDYFPPAAVNLGSGFEFMHTIFSPFQDRIGNTLTGDLTSTYNNPGTLLLAPGIKIFPFKGHQIDLFYIYRRVIESEALEQELLNREGVAVSVDDSILHELGLLYTWSPNPHFNIRVFGGLGIPSDGVKDIASAQDCNANVAGLQPCDGDDVSLRGEIRFRAQF